MATFAGVPISGGGQGLTFTFAVNSNPLLRAVEKAEARMERFAKISSKKIRHESDLMTTSVISNYKRMGNIYRDQLKKNEARTKQWRRKSEEAANKVGETWWKRFGAVALGFTIAYRAMNIFENILRNTVSVIQDAIRESGEYAALQAKLAMWTTMHTAGVISFSDAYAKAAVNINALRKASISSLSTLEELSTGVDEIAQTIGVVPAKMMKGITTLIDFTVLVAQTTGSTTRQIRQELQALLNGQIRTTDQLIRTMKKMGVVTEEDIRSLKAMTNQVAIFSKVVNAVSPVVQAAFKEIVSADITKAAEFWRKQIRFTFTEAVRLASQMEGVSNLFGEVFFNNATKFQESLSIVDWERNVELMRQIRNVMIVLNDMFEELVLTAGKLATIVSNAPDQLAELNKYLGVTVTIIKDLLIIGVVAAGLKTFVKAAKWLVISPLLQFLGLLKSVVLAIGLIPVAMALAAASISVAMKMLDDATPNIKEFFSSATGIKTPRMQDVDIGSFLLERQAKLKDASSFFGEPDTGPGLDSLIMSKSFTDRVKAGFTRFSDIFIGSTKEITEYWKQKGGPTFEAIKKQYQELLTPGGLGVGGEMDETMSAEGLEFVRRQKELTAKELEKLQKAKEKAEDEWTKILIKNWIRRQKIAEDLVKAEARADKKMRRRIVKTAGERQKEFKQEAKFETKFSKIRTKLAEDTTTKINRLTLSSEDFVRWQAHKTFEEQHLLATGRIDLQKQVTKAYELQLEEISRRYNQFGQHMVDLSQGIATAMSQSFSDFFFQAFTGQLESLADLLDSFLNSVLRTLTDVMGKITAELVVGTATGSGGSMTGGIISGLINAVTGFASGGWIPEPVLGVGQSGRLYSFAERGPEYVNSAGSGGGGSQTNIFVDNHTGQQATTSQKQNRTGGRDILVTIGEGMAGDIRQGGPLHQQMRQTFGLRPSVGGR